MLARYSELQTSSGTRDGYSIDLKSRRCCAASASRGPTRTRPAETFSGGWQMRIALAKLLLGRPGLLLLDEPTNHLDLDARNWLEDYLDRVPHAVILVSHDRFFLDSVVTRIADLEPAHAHRLPRQLQPLHRRARRAAWSGCARRSRSRTRKSRASSCSSIASGTRPPRRAGPEPHQAARQGRADRGPARAQADPLHVPGLREERPDGDRAEARHARHTAISCVFRDLSLHIERGDRIALVGPNGAGKSTLMRMLSGVEAPDARRRGRRATRS